MSVVILCGALIDGTGAMPHSNAEIHIDGGHITWAGPRTDASRPAGANVVDLGDLTVLPGLIDCHDHFGLDVGDEEAQCRDPLEYIALRGAKNARRILESGITTVRNVGEKGRIGPMLKRAIDEGLIPGPRVLTAGRNIVRTGGHTWWLGVEADGVDGLVAAIRTEVANGADLIKIMVTGGVSTRGSDVLAPEFSEAEVNAVVQEAKLRGRRVAAHGHGGPGVRMAVEAGVDSIEHGMFLTPQDVQLMVEHGTYLVVTVGIYGEILHHADVPVHMKTKVTEARGTYLKMLTQSRGTGLKIALGTDLNHGKLYQEMQFLVEAGYTPMEAILAGTRDAAALCGIADKAGTIEAGKLADLIGVQGDPLDDLSRLADVRYVMKDGRVEAVRGTA